MSNALTERRLGEVSVSVDVVEGFTELEFQRFCKKLGVVVRFEMNYVTHTFEYIVANPEFSKVASGKCPPKYEMVFTKTSELGDDIIIHWRIVEPC